MESKVLLFNEEDTKVGETFMRRARQLVSRQRAEWVDESHSAIRFARDAEIETEEPVSAPARPSAGNALYALAEKRIRERKLYIIHCVMLMPMWIFILGMLGDTMRYWEFAMFLFGGSMTAFAIHTWVFFKERLRDFRRDDRRERRARQLAIEMDKLRRMGYAE